MHTQLQTAAEVLAMAVCELFPNAQRLQAHTTGIGYAYDFILKQSIDPPLFSLIETKMREIGKRQTPIEPVEMLRSNAQELFRHHGQFALADELEEEPHPLLPLIRIGTFYDRALPGIGRHTGEIGATHLLRAEKLEENIIRLHGLSMEDKKSLSTFIKQLEKGKKFDHLLLGKELKLFLNDSWLPRGVELRRRLRNWWEELHLNQNFSFSYSAPDQPENIQPLLQCSRICEIYTDYDPPPAYPFPRGLLTSPVETRDLASIYCQKEQFGQEITSSLQFIKKTINIFAFEHHWCLITSGRQKKGPLTHLQQGLQQCNLEYKMVEDPECARPRVEVRIADAFGEEWPGPRLEIEEQRGLIKRSLFGSMERFIALLIEQHHGALPLWLAPEQVRIIVVNERNAGFASGLAQELAKTGCFSKTDTSLKSVGQRVKAAIEEKIPYIAVIGDKEMETDSVTLRQEEGGELNRDARAFVEEIGNKIKGRF